MNTPDVHDDVLIFNNISTIYHGKNYTNIKNYSDYSLYNTGLTYRFGEKLDDDILYFGNTFDICNNSINQLLYDNSINIINDHSGNKLIISDNKYNIILNEILTNNGKLNINNQKLYDYYYISLLNGNDEFIINNAINSKNELTF